MWKPLIRRLGKLGFVGVGGLLISICYNAVTQFYPLTGFNFVNQCIARWLFWVFVGLGVIGVILILVALCGSKRWLNQQEKQILIHKESIIEAIAEFEAQARRMYTDMNNREEYQRSRDNLQKEMLVTNLADGKNPISELVVFATVQIAWREGQITGTIHYFKTPLEFVGSLMGKAIQARQYIEEISK